MRLNPFSPLNLNLNGCSISSANKIKARLPKISTEKCHPKLKQLMHSNINQRMAMVYNRLNGYKDRTHPQAQRT